MIGPGIPETLDEAKQAVHNAAAAKPGMPSLPFWPHGQIIALSQMVTHLSQRIEKLESDKPRRGRPPKVVADATADLADRVAENL